MSYIKDKENIIKRYDSRMNESSDEVTILAVGNIEKQMKRFRILADISPDIFNSKILDLGCGYGDFYGFLLAQQADVQYTGYDINPRLIESARKKFPSGIFAVTDILSGQVNETFDYVVSSSSFNNKLEHVQQYQFIEKILSKCYEICEKGVAINFLTSYVDYEMDHAFYYSPERIFSIGKTISRNITIRHDYDMFEFTLYLYKNSGYS